MKQFIIMMERDKKKLMCSENQQEKHRDRNENKRHEDGEKK